MVPKTKIAHKAVHKYVEAANASFGCVSWFAEGMTPELFQPQYCKSWATLTNLWMQDDNRDPTRSHSDVIGKGCASYDLIGFIVSSDSAVTEHSNESNNEEAWC